MSRIEFKIVALGDFNNVQQAIAKLDQSISALNKNIAGVGLQATQIQSVKNMVAEFDKAILSTGHFTAKTVQLQTETEKFGKALDGGKLKLKEYYNIITQGSKDAQAQIRALAVEQTRLQNSIIVKDPLKGGVATVYTPTKINEVANATKIAANQQMLYNLALDRGATSLINWGKNTQWAGRQLTVGLTVPLTMFGAQTARIFQSVDTELTRMQKVYGTGLAQPTQQALAAIRKDVTALAKELAQSWGVPIQETAGMAADLAATGKTGLDLVNATREAIRLAKLGEVDRQQAMQATVSLQNVYKLNTTQLAEAVNFLNAVENQTSTSLQDLVDAIPRVGPIVAQLGGSFKDTAAMMVAMKEAGVPAAQAANAIKSAMASLINPSKDAKDTFSKFHIDLKAISQDTGGKPVLMLKELADQMKNLDKLSQAQLIEKLFGKFQFSRVQALLDNLNKAGSQAQTVFQLMNASNQQLSQMAEAELKVQTESTTGKFKRTLETLKADLVPIGEEFTKIITKLLEFGDSVVKLTDKLGPLKNVLGLILGFVSVAGPILMLAGVFGNLFGYIFKGVSIIRNLAMGTKGLAGATGILTAENIAAANASELFGNKMIQEVEDVNILRNAIAQLTLQMESYNNTMMGGTSVASKVAGLKVTGSTTAQGLEFAHGMAPTMLTEEQKSMIRTNQPGSKFLKDDIRYGLSNFGLMVPSALNRGKMSGIEASEWLQNQENAKIATSKLLATIVKTVPEAANNPAVIRDMEKLAQNLAKELKKAGTQAVTEPQFYQAVEKALAKTLTKAADAATIQGIKNAQQVTTVVTSSRGGRGERVPLIKKAQQSLFGLFVPSYKGMKNPAGAIVPAAESAIATQGAAASETAILNTIAPEIATGAGAVAKTGILSKLRGLSGGGMGGLAAMMAFSMFGDKLPKPVQSIGMGASTGAMIGSFIPGVGTGIGAIAGAAVSGLMMLMEKEKEHQAMAEATFKSSTAVAKLFGGAVEDISFHMSNLNTATVNFTGFTKQYREFVDMVKKLPKDDPLSLFLNNIKGQTGGELQATVRAFTNTQIAMGNLKPDQVSDYLKMILTYTGQMGQYDNLVSGIGQTRSAAITGSLNALPRVNNKIVTTGTSRGTITTEINNYNDLNKAQKEVTDSLSNFYNLANNTTDIKTLEDVVKGIGDSAYNSADGFNLLKLYAEKMGDKGLVNQLNALRDAGLDLAKALLVIRAESLGIDLGAIAPQAAALGLPAATVAKTEDIFAAITEALKKYNDVISGKGAGGKGTSGNLDSLIAALEKQKNALEEEKSALDKSIQSQKDYNDQLQKTQDFLVKQTDLQNQIRIARAKGDYLQAGLLQQQLTSAQVTYNATASLSPAEQRSKDLQDAIDALTIEIRDANQKNKDIKKANKASGGYIRSYGQGSWGGVFGPGSATSDSIPAMLSNGEYVLSASAVKNVPGGIKTLDGINSGNMSAFNSNVNNSYSIAVNVANSNASPDEIAQVVMRTIERRANMNSTLRVV